MQTFEEDITRILASIDGEDQEDTKPQEAEPIETYDVYPVPGGMMILKREEVPASNQVIDTHLDHKRPEFFAYTAIVFSTLLLLFLISSAFYQTFFPIDVAVTLLPKTQTFTATTSIRVVPGTPGARDIQGRRLPTITLSQMATVPATGKRHQDPASATGNVTFYNGQFSAQFVPAGKVLIGSDGTQIVTDQDASIPAANPPIFGQVTVSAHAVLRGRGGNIRAYDINESCCFASVLVKNSGSFTGGLDERNFIVVTKGDIDTVSTLLKTSLSESMQGALSAQAKQSESLITLPCGLTITSDHKAGEEATQVQVTASETCSAVAYETLAVEKKAVSILFAQAKQQLGTIYHVQGSVQISVIQTTITNTAITLKVRSAGTWIYTISRATGRSVQQKIAGKNKVDAIKLLIATPGVQAARIQGIEEYQKLPRSVSAIRIVIIA